MANSNSIGKVMADSPSINGTVGRGMAFDEENRSTNRGQVADAATDQIEFMAIGEGNRGTHKRRMADTSTFEEDGGTDEEGMADTTTYEINDFLAVGEEERGIGGCDKFTVSIEVVG